MTIVDRQGTFTNTFTRITGMVMALGLQSVTVVDRQATFTGTSTRISSICVSGFSVHTVTDCSHRTITMLPDLVEVPVKVACVSMTFTDYSHRAITMQFIVVEVLVKVACQSTTVTD